MPNYATESARSGDPLLPRTPSDLAIEPGSSCKSLKAAFAKKAGKSGFDGLRSGPDGRPALSCRLDGRNESTEEGRPWKVEARSIQSGRWPVAAGKGTALSRVFAGLLLSFLMEAGPPAEAQSVGSGSGSVSPARPGLDPISSVRHEAASIALTGPSSGTQVPASRGAAGRPTGPAATTADRRRDDPSGDSGRAVAGRVRAADADRSTPAHRVSPRRHGPGSRTPAGTPAAPVERGSRPGCDQHDPGHQRARSRDQRGRGPISDHPDSVATSFGSSSPIPRSPMSSRSTTSRALTS